MAFNPAMMQQATQMYANMTAEQRESMYKQFASLDPAMIANMQRMMGGGSASPEQIAQMQQQMRSTPASVIDQNLQSEPAKKLMAAMTAKMEGNEMFKNADYAGAKAKYEAALDAIEAVPEVISHPEARSTQQSCKLNLALCCLKLSEFSRAETLCNDILQGEPNSVKALYRRGVAREGLGRLATAERDLAAALKLSPGDDNTKQALERVRAARAAQGDAAASPDTEQFAADDDAADSGSDGEETDDTDSGKDKAKPEPSKTPAAGKPSASSVVSATPATTPTAIPTPSAADMSAVTNMMRDPAMRGFMQQQMQDPAVRAQMRSQTGMDISDEQLNMATRMMESMPPEQLENLMKMSAAMRGGAGMPSMAPPTSAASAASPAGPSSSVASASSASSPAFDASNMAAQSAQMMQNPEMRRAMHQMMSNMDSETLSSLARQTGMNMSPEMAEKLTRQMKEMPPETFDKLMVASAKLQGFWSKIKSVWDFFFGSKLRAAGTVMLVALLAQAYFS